MEIFVKTEDSKTIMWDVAHCETVEEARWNIWDRRSVQIMVCAYVVFRRKSAKGEEEVDEMRNVCVWCTSCGGGVRKKKHRSKQGAGTGGRCH